MSKAIIAEGKNINIRSAAWSKATDEMHKPKKNKVHVSFVFIYLINNHKNARIKKYAGT
jgi:hypothetical protein